MEEDLFAGLDPEAVNVVAGWNMLVDTMMQQVFFKNEKAVQVVIRIVLGKEDIEVEQVEIQKVLPNLTNHGVRLDVLARDSAGKYYNIEIQRSEQIAIGKRVRYNSALTSASIFEKGKSYQELADVHIIFLTEYDTYQSGLPLYHVEKRIAETGEIYKDGESIVFANVSYQGNDELGRLMADFRATDPNTMHYPELKERMHFLKTTKEGMSIMCKETEKLIKIGELRGEANGETKGIVQTCQEFGLSIQETINKLMTKKNISESTAREQVKQFWVGTN